MLPTVVISGGGGEKHSPVRCHSDGLIELRLQIVDAGSLEDLVVHYYPRWGGLKLTRTYFILILTTVVISSSVEEHSPVRCHFDGLIELLL